MWRMKRFILAHTFRGISPRSPELMALCLRWGRTSLCLEPVAEADHCLIIKKQERDTKEPGGEIHFSMVCSSELFSPTNAKSLNNAIVLQIHEWIKPLIRSGFSCLIGNTLASPTHPEMCTPRQDIILNISLLFSWASQHFLPLATGFLALSEKLCGTENFHNLFIFLPKTLPWLLQQNMWQRNMG